jgi:hypothetical protein
MRNKKRIKNTAVEVAGVEVAGAVMQKAFQRDENYLDQIGRLSPIRLDANPDDQVLYISILALPDNRYAMYVDNKVLYYTLDEMPDWARTSLLLVKSRSSIGYTSKTYEDMSLGEYQKLVTEVFRPFYSSDSFVDVGFMPIPGVYCIAVNADKLSLETNHEWVL